MLPAEEATFDVTGVDSRRVCKMRSEAGDLEMAMVRVPTSNQNYAHFMIEASYLESEAGPVINPYTGDTLVLNDDIYADGAYLQPDVLQAHCANSDHPELSRKQWRSNVFDCETELGYWEAVAARVTLNRRQAFEQMSTYP